jgi:hypothetical protein
MIEQSEDQRSSEDGTGAATERETTLTIKWIAEQLHMGSQEYASRLLYAAKTKKTSQR